MNSIGASFVLVVASRHAGEALRAEVPNPGGSDAIEIQFTVGEAKRVIGSGLQGVSIYETFRYSAGAHGLPGGF